MIRAALIQMTSEYDSQANVEKASTLIESAAKDGASIVCLQELFHTVYFPWEMSAEHFALAEPLNGPIMRRMRELARQYQIVLIAPIFEQEIDGLYFNSAPVIGPDGDLIGCYRKSHIPIVHGNLITGFEKYYFSPGNTGFEVFTTPFGVRIGILICYDRHFPEAARVLALSGAEIVFVPTATLGMSRPSWEIELQAHAINNGYFVGGVNRVGIDEDGCNHPFFGSSVWIDPRGSVVARANETTDEVLHAEIDPSIIAPLRNDWGFLRDRRPDLYSGLHD